MTTLALLLVLAAALLHATWNLAAKRSGGGVGFVWLGSAASTVLYLPLALGALLVLRPRLGPPELTAMLVSGTLHLVYFVTLQRGYKLGDLSLVYPLARGTGPMLATVGAILILGERPSHLALAGAVLIAVGVFVLALGNGDVRSSGAAIAYGLVTGVVIAVYTVWDKHAVGALAIPPLIYDWGNGALRTAALLPVALRNRAEIGRLWRAKRPEVLTVAVCAPLAYILVLTALVFTPVSYVAPAREVSILFGAVMGHRLLGEGQGRRRLVAAAGMALGVVLLAVG